MRSAIPPFDIRQRDWPSAPSLCFARIALLLVLLNGLLVIGRAATQKESSNLLFIEDESEGPDTDVYNHYIMEDDMQIPSPYSGASKLSIAALLNVTDGMRLTKEPPTTERKPTPRLTSRTVLTTGTGIPTSKLDTPQVRISPPYLDFKERGVSLPAVQHIEIVNLHDNAELQLLSILIDSPHFHTSFVKNSIVPPGANITISVVFLPRMEGAVDTTFSIHTSAGTFVFQVFGRGIPNPYKVSPLVGVKVPVQAKFQPIISLYNPYDETISVKEVFSSGGFLHLTLPEQSDSAENAVIRAWDIPPHQKRAIIQLNFSSATPGKFQGFVNIRATRENLVVPVEVVVVKSGIHRTPEELDFGVVSTMQEKKTLEVRILNSSPTAVLFSDLQAALPEPQLDIDFSPATVPAQTEAILARVTLLAKSEGVFKGKLLLRTNDSNPVNARIEIPYKWRAFAGTIGFQQGSVTFAATSGAKPLKQDIVLVNRFSVPVMIYSVEIPHPQFKVTRYTPFQSADPGMAWDAIKLRFTPVANDMFLTTLILNTNVSTLTIPLQIYNGMVSINLPGETPSPLSEQGIDFGTMGLDEIRTKTINISNSNPIRIPITKLHADLVGVTMRLESVWNAYGYRANTASKDLIAPSASKTKTPSTEPVFILEPGHSAIVSFEVNPKKEESKQGKVVITTPYESRTIKINYQSLGGQLDISPTHLVFSAGAEQVPLYALSTFSRSINISSITSSDSRIVTTLTCTRVEPNIKTQIGLAKFDPLRRSIPTSDLTATPQDYDLHEFLYREELSEEDFSKLRAAARAWASSSGDNDKEQAVRATLTVRTDLSGVQIVQVKATKARHAIVEENSVEFSIQQLKTQSQRYIPVFNPSTDPILVQLFLPPNNDRAFYFPAGATRKLVLPPGKSAQMGPLAFLPYEVIPIGISTGDSKTHFDFTTTVLVRNNLTVLESVPVQGSGGSGRLVVAGMEFDDQVDSDVLQFNVDPSELQACLLYATSSGEDDPISMSKASVDAHSEDEAIKPIVLTRKVKAINKGNLPLTVQDFRIGHWRCAGHGFTVNNCNGFVLQPDEEADLSLSYQPDFSAATVKRDLVVTTSSGDVKFPMKGSLPSAFLPKCREVYGSKDLDGSSSYLAIMVVFVLSALVFAARQQVFGTPADDSKGEKFLCVNLPQLSTSEPTMKGDGALTGSAVSAPTGQKEAKDVDTLEEGIEHTHGPAEDKWTQVATKKAKKEKKQMEKQPGGADAGRFEPKSTKNEKPKVISKEALKDEPSSLSGPAKDSMPEIPSVANSRHATKDLFPTETVTAFEPAQKPGKKKQHKPEPAKQEPAKQEPAKQELAAPVRTTAPENKKSTPKTAPVAIIKEKAPKPDLVSVKDVKQQKQVKPSKAEGDHAKKDVPQTSPTKFFNARQKEGMVQKKYVPVDPAKKALNKQPAAFPMDTDPESILGSQQMALRKRSPSHPLPSNGAATSMPNEQPAASRPSRASAELKKGGKPLSWTVIPQYEEPDMVGRDIASSAEFTGNEWPIASALYSDPTFHHDSPAPSFNSHDIIMENYVSPLYSSQFSSSPDEQVGGSGRLASNLGRALPAQPVTNNAARRPIGSARPSAGVIGSGLSRTDAPAAVWENMPGASIIKIPPSPQTPRAAHRRGAETPITEPSDDIEWPRSGSPLRRLSVESDEGSSLFTGFPSFFGPASGLSSSPPTNPAPFSTPFPYTPLDGSSSPTYEMTPPYPFGGFGIDATTGLGVSSAGVRLHSSADHTSPRGFEGIGNLFPLSRSDSELRTTLNGSNTSDTPQE